MRSSHIVAASLLSVGLLACTGTNHKQGTASNPSDVCGPCTDSSGCADPLAILELTCVSGICQVDPSNGANSCENSDCIGLCDSNQQCSCFALCAKCGSTSDCASPKPGLPTLTCAGGLCQLPTANNATTCNSTDCVSDGLGICDAATGACECGVTPPDVCQACTSSADCVDQSGNNVPLTCQSGVCQISGSSAGLCAESDCAFLNNTCNTSTQGCECGVAPPDSGAPSDICGPCTGTGTSNCMDMSGQNIPLVCVGGQCQVSTAAPAGSCDKSDCVSTSSSCDESNDTCQCGLVPDAGGTSDVCQPCTSSSQCVDGSNNGIQLVCGATGVCLIAPNQASGTCDMSDCEPTNFCNENTQACECGVTPVDICGSCNNTTSVCQDQSGNNVPLECVGGTCQITPNQPAGTCEMSDCTVASSANSCNDTTNQCQCVGMPDAGPPPDAGNPDAGPPSDICGPCTSSSQCVNATGAPVTLTCLGGICQIAPDGGLCDNTNCGGSIGTCNETTQICKCASKTSDVCGPCTTAADCSDPSGTVTLICKSNVCQIPAGVDAGTCALTDCPLVGGTCQSNQECQCGTATAGSTGTSTGTSGSTGGSTATQGSTGASTGTTASAAAGSTGGSTAASSSHSSSSGSTGTAGSTGSVGASSGGSSGSTG